MYIVYSTDMKNIVDSLQALSVEILRHGVGEKWAYEGKDIHS